MATAYQSVSHSDAIAMSKHWDQAVPLPDEELSFQPQNMFEHKSYTFPSENNFRVENTPPDYGNLRESSRPLKTQRSGPMDTSAYEGQHDRDSSQSHSRTRRPSVPPAKGPAPGRKRSVGTALNTEGPSVDDSAWIHRDKLAQIESREMAQAGIRVRRSSRPRETGEQGRSASRSASRANEKPDRRNKSRDRLNTQTSASEDVKPSMLPAFQDRPQYQADSDSPTDNDPLDYDPAMLQFTSNERSLHSHTKSINNKSITSRIPVARASPAPVSNAVVGRDSPLTRNRAGSSTLSGNAGENPSYRQHRPRSQSLGSQTVLDDVVGSRTSNTTVSRPVSSHMTSPRNSQIAKDSPNTSPKKKTTTAKSSSMNGKKTNTTKVVQTRSRTTSGVRKTSPGSRPVSASKRPQGDAPWIATMYKPDPRLPQDQQILPTHAKRMMQEQQERGGVNGSASDRDFDLLDDNDLEKMGAFPTPSPQVEQAESTPGDQQSPRKSGSNYEAPWPLSPINSESRQSRAENTQSRQSITSGGGGYRITPTIPLPSPSPVPFDRPATARSTRSGLAPQIMGPQKSAVTRVPDPEMNEKSTEKKEKSCGCCIVM